MQPETNLSGKSPTEDPQSAAGQRGDGQTGDAEAVGGTKSAKTGANGKKLDRAAVGADQAGPVTAANLSGLDHARARGLEKKQIKSTNLSGLPSVEIQQDDKTFSLGQDGKIARVKDNDGLWVSTDGVNFTQAGTDKKRTLSKDNQGRFLFVDHDLMVKEAQRIHQALTELHQYFRGRDQEQCERDIRNALADKSADEIKALDAEYQNEFKQPLHGTLTADSKISGPTQEAIATYWKGAQSRTDDDVLALADTALKHANINLFEEAMRDASVSARKKFTDGGGDQKIYSAFTQTNVNRRTGTRTVTETPDLARARDYAADGKLSVATQVHDNKGNEQAIEAALHNMTDADRKKYLLGKAIAAGAAPDKSVSDADKMAAKAYYEKTYSAFDAAGNATEKALWEGLVTTPDNGTLAKLASHRGWLYNDSTGTIASEIEQMNSADVALLRDKDRGPQYRAQIENVLRSYLKDADARPVLDVVDTKVKAKTDVDAQESAQRAILDKMADGVHWFKSNDQGAMVKALVDMTPQEQANYRSNVSFRQQLDHSVAAHMSGDGQKAAQYLLKRTLADKDGKNTKADSREDLVVKLYERAMNGDSDNAVRDLQGQFIKQPQLRDAINNAKTPEEKDFAANFKAAVADAVVYHAPQPETSSQTAVRLKYGGPPPVSDVNTGYDHYVKPLLDTGYLPVSNMIALSKNPEMPVDQKALIKDLVYVSPAERQKLLADSAYCSQALGIGNPEDLKIAQNVLRQGSVAPEDSIRLNVRNWGGGDEIMETLQSTRLKDLPAVEKAYQTKYGGSLEKDAENKLSGAQKQQAIRLFRQIHEGVPEQVVDSEVDASRARSGIGSALSDAVGHGTGPQLDDTVNQCVRVEVGAAQNGKHLSDAQLQTATDATYTNLDNFIKEKQSAADTVTNIGTVAGAIGLTYVTGGAALPLLISGAAYGAAFRVASQKLVMGENYDATVKQLSKDITLGGVEGGVIGVTPELLMGTGAAAAKLASAEVLEGTAGQALTQEGRQVLTSGLRKLVQDGLCSGAKSISDADIEALAAKAGNPDLAGAIKNALPKAYEKEYQKIMADGLRQLKANSAAGAVGGGIAGGGNAALNLDPRASTADKLKTVTVGTFTGAAQGALTGAIMTGVGHGIKAGLKSAAVPVPVPEPIASVPEPIAPAPEGNAELHTEAAIVGAGRATTRAPAQTTVQSEAPAFTGGTASVDAANATATAGDEGGRGNGARGKEGPKNSGPTGKGSNDGDQSEDERKKQALVHKAEAGGLAPAQSDAPAVVPGAASESVKLNPDRSQLHFEGAAGDAGNPLRVTQTTDVSGQTVKYEYEPGTNNLRRVTYDTGVQIEILDANSVRITGPGYPKAGTVDQIKLRVDSDGTRYFQWHNDPVTSLKLDGGATSVDAQGNTLYKKVPGRAEFRQVNAAEVQVTPEGGKPFSISGKMEVTADSTIVHRTGGGSLEISDGNGKIIATTDAAGRKTQYEWQEIEGKTQLVKVSRNGIAEERIADDVWSPDKKHTQVVGTRQVDEQGALIETNRGSVYASTKYNLDGSTELTFSSGAKTITNEQGLPISTVDANKDHIAYQWEQVSGTPRLSRVTYESKDGVTELQRTAAGWTATRDDARLIPAQAKITDVGVEGQGAELTVSVDRAPADGGPRNLSFRSDGARSSSIPNTSDAISNLLKTGTVIPDQADVNEEGLLKVIRYGTVSDGEGNQARVLLRKVNDPRDPSTLDRIRQTQIARDLHTIDKGDGPSPDVVIRDVVLDGKMETVALIPDQGKDFTSTLRRWTAIANNVDGAVKGLPATEWSNEVSTQQMVDFVKTHPTLYKSVGEAMARRMIDGGMDFQTTNWAVAETRGGAVASPDGPIHLTDIDSKRSYSTDPKISWGKEMEWGEQVPIARLYEGKSLAEVSPTLQKEVEQNLALYKTVQGRQALRDAGLTEPQIDARIARVEGLLKDGFPPVPSGEPAIAGMEYYPLPDEYKDRMAANDVDIESRARAQTVESLLQYNNRVSVEGGDAGSPEPIKAPSVTPPAPPAAPALLKEGKFEFLGYSDDSSRSQIGYGRVSDGAGHSQEVVLHFDAGAGSLTESPAAIWTKYENAKITNALYELGGIEDRVPSVALRQVEVPAPNGTTELKTAWLEAKGGPNLETALADAAKKQYGSSSPEDIAQLIEADPRLHQNIEMHTALRLSAMDGDFQFSNGVVGTTADGTPDLTKPIMDIDLAKAYGTGNEPNFGYGAAQDPTRTVAQMYSGQPLSSETKNVLQRIIDKMHTPAGQQSLLDAGMSQAQIDAYAARAKNLIDNGFPHVLDVRNPIAMSDADFQKLQEFDDRVRAHQQEQLARHSLPPTASAREELPPTVPVDSEHPSGLPEESGGIDGDTRRSESGSAKPETGGSLIDLNARPLGVVDSQGRLTEMSDYGNTHKFAYDAQGNLKSFTRADGTQFHTDNGTQWYKTVTGANGEAEEKLVLGKDSPVRVKATPNGDIEYRYGRDEDNPELTDVEHLDGSVERMRAGGRSDVRIADYGFEKQVLKQSVDKAFPDAARAARFNDLLAKFESSASARGLDQNDQALFFKQLSRLLKDRPDAALSLATRADLAEQVLNHANDVSSVDQGCNGTCNVSTLEHRDYYRHPDQMARIVADATLTGRYVTADGQVIQLGTLERGIRPDSEARNSVKQQASGSDGRVHVDGTRDFASQIVQNTFANVRAQTESVLLDGDRMLPPRSLAYDKGGKLVGKVERATDIRPIYDKNHQLLTDWKPGDPAYTLQGKPWAEDGRYDDLSAANVVYDETGKLLGYLPHEDAEVLYDAQGKRLSSLPPGATGYDRVPGGALQKAVTRTQPGQIVYDKATPEGPYAAGRLLYNDGKQVVALRDQDGQVIDSPYFLVPSDVFNNVNRLVLGEQEQPFVLLLGEKSRTEGGNIFVKTKEDLAASIEQLQKNHNLPAVVRVHTNHAAFKTGGVPDASGVVGRWHVVNIDGYDAKTGMVLVGNSHGTRNQYLDEGLPLNDLFQSMQNPLPAK